jgi:hypothetical protein
VNSAASRPLFGHQAAPEDVALPRGFSQKSNGKLSADGDTIEGLWKLSRDDSTWADDLALTFRRR